MSLPNIEPPHDLDALFLGTAEFRFCEGATSIAVAAATGYRDFGNVKVATPSTDVTVEEHMGSYRGRLIKDKLRAKEASLAYKITSDEWNTANVTIAFGGTLNDPITQSASAATPGDTLDTLVFTGGAPSALNKSYPLLKSTAQVYNITEANVYGPITTCTGANAGDVITATAHGLANGDRVLIEGAGVAAGLTAGETYYVISSTTNTFQLSLTSGGAAIVLTADSTAMTFARKMVTLVDYVVDPELGSIRFLVAQTGNVRVKAVFGAIVAGDGNGFSSIAPLGNIVREGFGEIVFYDQDDTKRVVMRHTPFRCSLRTESIGGADGSSWGELAINVLVLPPDLGAILVRDKNDQLVAA